MSTEFESLVDSLRRRVAADPDLSGLELLSLVRPSIRLVAQRVPDVQIELGASRIGGSPDVLPGFAWPRWVPAKKRNDKFGQPWCPDKPTPLGFIAQIDLSAVPQVNDLLPSSGWLCFFYDRYSEAWGFDPADRGCCSVVYFNGDRSSLYRAEPPTDLDPEHIAHSCVVEAWPELTLPDDLRKIEYGTSVYEAYRALREELIKPGGLVYHRLMGHPQLIQNPMELECQLASNGIYCGGASRFQEAEAKALEPGAADWRLLLQIDTDEDGPGWMWGDVGRIYFWIKQQDLATRCFDHVWLIFQCC
jgi:uncharacterized protein YwqG